jgi:hypothetical protein
MRNPGVFFLTATIVLSAASLGLAQGWKRFAKPGPYRVVVTETVVPRGATVPGVFNEDPELSEVFNRLDREGFAPLTVVSVASGTSAIGPGESTAIDSRLVIVAVQR